MRFRTFTRRSEWLVADLRLIRTCHSSRLSHYIFHKSCDSGSFPSMNKKNKLRYGQVFIVEHRNWVSRRMILGWLELDRHGCFANIRYHNRCVLVMLGGWARWRPYFQGSKSYDTLLTWTQSLSYFLFSSLVLFLVIAGHCQECNLDIVLHKAGKTGQVQPGPSQG